MIDRPMYVDKIMAYTDTPFVKILTVDKLAPIYAEYLLSEDSAAK